MKMNGKGPSVLVGVSVVTLLGGWKSLEPVGLPPVNESLYVTTCAMQTITPHTHNKPLELIFCNRLSTDLSSSLIFLSAPCRKINIQHILLHTACMQSL